MDLDPGPEASKRINAGGFDAFFARYNSDGIYQWGWNIGSSRSNACLDMTLDASISKMSNSLGSTLEIFNGYGFIKSKPKPKEPDSIIQPDPVLRVLNQQKDTLTVALRNDEGFFVFVDLPDNPQYLFLLEGDDSDKLMVYINGKLVKLVKGMDNFFHYKDLPANISKLHLLDGDGNKLMTAVMSENGFFTFETLQSKSNYTFELESRYLRLVDQVRIAFTDENGKPVNMIVDKAPDGLFKYEFIPPSSAKLYLLNQKGDTLSFSELNADGFFVFSKLSPNESFLFALDADELDMIELIQVVSHNEAGELIILTASKGRDNFFRYEYLPDDQVVLFLVSTNGDTLQSAKVNEDGFFVFKQLPFDADYLFLLNDGDQELTDDLLILLIDQNGNEKIITAFKKTGRLFEYIVLPNKGEVLGLLDLSGDPAMLELDDEQVIKSAVANLQFNNGTDVIKIGSHRYLGQLSRLMAKNPSWNIELDGHTDNIGTVRHNLMLSKRRAAAVKKFLVNNRVDPERIKVRYYGEMRPIADNTSSEGRQTNRRVEMTVTRKASEERAALNRSDAIIYKVQVFASKNPVYLTPVNFKGIENVEEYQHEGLYKYLVGYSEDYDYAAAVLLYEIKQEGFDQAFIVAFKNGRRITIEEALNSK